MRVKNLRKSIVAIVGALTLAASLGACSSFDDTGQEGNTEVLETPGPTSEDASPEVSPESHASTFRDVDELVDAAIDGGYNCGHLSRQGESTWGESMGRCSASDTNVFVVYANQTDLKGQLDAWTEMQKGYSVLVGENWTITETEPTLYFLQKYLGGDIRVEEEGDPNSYSAQSVLIPEDPTLTPIFNDWFEIVGSGNTSNASAEGHRIGGDSDSIEFWVQWHNLDWDSADAELRGEVEELGELLAVLVYYAGDPTQTEIYNPKVGDAWTLKFFDRYGTEIGEWNPSLAAASFGG